MSATPKGTMLALESADAPYRILVEKMQQGAVATGADGTVLYCCNTDVVVGSLADARFADQWRGEAWQALRDRLRGGAYLPSCDQCGKLNQNVNIGRAFAAAYGDGRLRQVTGR